jgi:hypothetical protein
VGEGAVDGGGDAGDELPTKNLPSDPWVNTVENPRFIRVMWWMDADCRKAQKCLFYMGY